MPYISLQIAQENLVLCQDNTYKPITMSLHTTCSQDNMFES